MMFVAIPWLELAILLPLFGLPVVLRTLSPRAMTFWCIVFAFGGLVCATAACVAHLLQLPDSVSFTTCFALDAISAPLIPFVAIVHALTALATATTKAERFPFAGLLFGQSLRVATFACVTPLALAVLLALGTLPPYLELRKRGQSTRVYVIHMSLFVGLLSAGMMTSGTAAAVFLLLAVLVRGGTFPAHVWVTDLFERA